MTKIDIESAYDDFTQETLFTKLLFNPTCFYTDLRYPDSYKIVTLS